ncbi:MAG: phosphoribosylglycinamide formyltransferase [Mucinivorans sp.]
MKHIAIFASGSGTNAQAIMERMQNNPAGRVVALLSNKTDAYALTRAAQFGVETFVFKAQTLRDNPNEILDILTRKEVDLVVLAGFMLLMPAVIVAQYEGRIINIHPALLPSYGGKGMYGDNVHKAVIAAHEKQSGITIHYVNANYDDGSTIFQATTPITPGETADTLAAKIHVLEHQYFPEVIEKLCNER